MLAIVRVNDRENPGHSGTGTLLGFVNNGTRTYCMVALDHGAGRDQVVVEVRPEYVRVTGYRSSVGLMEGVN